MKYETINPKLFKKNRDKLKAMLPADSLVVINANDEQLRTGDQFYPFRQNSDLFYLTGLDQEKCILTLCPGHSNPKLREIVFTLQSNDLINTWQGHKYSKEEVTDISGVEKILWLDDFEMILRDLMSEAGTVYLNQNEYIKLSKEVQSRDDRFASATKEQFPLHQYARLAPIITELRNIKEPEEIALIQKACDITEKAFRRVCGFVKPGVMEYEIEAEMTHEFIRNRATGHAYQPIVGSGNNALVLHYITNNHECKDGDLLLMDFGAEYANYAADCTRTIPVNGKFSPRQKACYEAVLRIQKMATSLFVPGNFVDKVNKEVFKMMEKEMIGLGLFTVDDLKNQDAQKPLYAKYLMHGVTHPIGLDVHDVGSKYTEFKKGMVLTLEPAIYIAEENIGIRIENDIMIDGMPVDLMKNIPREVEEIEGMMRK